MTAHDPARCLEVECSACDAAYVDLCRVEDTLRDEVGDRAWFPLVFGYLEDRAEFEVTS